MTPRETYFDNLKIKLEETYTSQGFAFSAFNTKNEAKEFIIKSINKDDKIGYGGSATLTELGIIDYLRDNSYANLLDRDKARDNEEKQNIQIASFSSDVFLSSTNAMTMDGILVNIDMTGNRVAPMIYGPKHVYIVAGLNKLVLDKEEAMSRASNKSAIINNFRFNMPNPCTKLLKCVNCKEESRICIYTSLIRGSFPKGRIHVILINEELGF